MNEKLFREKLRRDIFSVIRDPLVIHSLEANRLQSKMRQAVAKFIDCDADRLFRMISPPDPRLPLGKWFERVFLVALRMTFPFGEVFHSVSDEQGGELDFLIQDSGR